MPRSDYLMRIVQQFSKALAALLSQTRSLDREPTFEELDQLSSWFAGFDLATLTALDTEHVLQLYSMTGSLDIEKAYVAGVVLHLAARHERDDDLERKALDVLQRVRDEFGEYVNDAHARRVGALEERLGVRDAEG